MCHWHCSTLGDGVVAVGYRLCYQLQGIYEQSREMDETYGVHSCWLSSLTCLNLPDSGLRRQLPF